MVGSFPACCAPAVSGHETADPAINLMKSRRRIAAPKAQSLCGLCFGTTQLQQGFPPGGMGFDRHFAWQQSSGPNVRFGSKADIAAPPTNVCFTPKSGRRNSVSKFALCQQRTFCAAARNVVIRSPRQRVA
jgi:hypothetical protein